MGTPARGSVVGGTPVGSGAGVFVGNSVRGVGDEIGVEADVGVGRAVGFGVGVVVGVRVGSGEGVYVGVGAPSPPSVQATAGRASNTSNNNHEIGKHLASNRFILACSSNCPHLAWRIW